MELCADKRAIRTPIITLDEETLKAEMREVVRETVEQVINGILDAQADELASAGRYERADERQAYRSGRYTRGPLTQAGRIEVSVPKLRGARLATEVIERHGRREPSVEEAMSCKLLVDRGLTGNGPVPYPILLTTVFQPLGAVSCQ